VYELLGSVPEKDLPLAKVSLDRNIFWRLALGWRQFANDAPYWFVIHKKPGAYQPRPVLHHKQAVTGLCDRVLHRSKRSLGNHAEVMRVETLSAQVVKLSKPVPQEQR